MSGHITTTRQDLDLMVPELLRAHVEVAAIPPDLYRYKREEAMLEPGTRMLMVWRALGDILRRHGFLETKCKSRGRRARRDPRQLWLAIDLEPNWHRTPRRR